MAQLSGSKPVVHVSPIWPKRKRPKSFKSVTKNLVKLIRFVQKVASPASSASEQDLAEENRRKEERLEKVKGLAKLKGDGSDHDERNQNGWKIYREKIRYLDYLERLMNHDTRNKPTRSASRFGDFKHFRIEGKKIELKSLKNNKNAKECKLKGSSSVVAHVINSRGAVDSMIAKGRSNQGNALSNTTPKTVEEKNVKKQLPSFDAKRDPRFQNLMRSLTPIDC